MLYGSFGALGMVAKLVFLAAVLSPVLALATTRIPIPFDDLVLQADFVGVVRCSKAGSIVAEYEVLETWKLTTETSTATAIRISMSVEAWTSRHPVTLVGETFVVTAFRNPPSSLMSTTSGRLIPQWWRRTRSDFRLPLAQGRVPVKPQGDWSSLRKRVAAVLAKEQTFVRRKTRDRPSVPEVDARASLLTPYHAKKRLQQGEVSPLILASLAESEPQMISGLLLHWKSPTQQDLGIVYGSILGHFGPPENAPYLIPLLDADDPWIKVAAGVYLQFSDGAKAEAALRTLAQLPDAPGAWAALTLARRGDKSWIPRVIALLPADELDFPSGRDAHEILAARLLELLSNSAAASGVEPPPYPKVPQSTHDFIRTDILRWWNSVEPRITVKDPWLEELAQQRMD